MAELVAGARDRRLLWLIPFLLVAAYVAFRMDVTHLWADVATPLGVIQLPNTYASVDHPFHAARADTLWRTLGSASILRWVGQHQGGYPVEFYPLGEAWLEVGVRAVSLGSLPAEGAHTIAVIALFLLPGVAYTALASVDRAPVVVAFLALCLHIALPGGWYHGGYTELVQWGLVTNVAGAVAALLMLPVLLRYVRDGAGWTAALAAGLGATAVYCNPRSLLGLFALGCGVAITALLDARVVRGKTVLLRMAFVAAMAALLAGPELISLARFGKLYAFVRYSGYTEAGDYLTATVEALSWAVVILGVAALVPAVVTPDRWALRATAVSFVLYVFGTMAVSFIPAIAMIAPQLEPTRLMPLQRFLTIYLAAAAIWFIWQRLVTRIPGVGVETAGVAAVVVAGAFLLLQTRPLPGPAPDPASPLVPPVSLYPVAMSAQPQQADLATAIRAADEAASPGTAILVLGSDLSWHQQLWAPLWTERPLIYDNWLWFWHPYHAGTPGYVFAAGNHYPDPRMTMRPDFVQRHGIGAVVVTGSAQGAAASAPWLSLIRSGTYATYVVAYPSTIVSTANQDWLRVSYANQRISAATTTPADTFLVRVNWFPRWSATIDGHPVATERRADGYIDIRGAAPGQSLRLVYDLQTWDWIGRGAALLGVVLAVAAGLRRIRVGAER